MGVIEERGERGQKDKKTVINFPFTVYRLQFTCYNKFMNKKHIFWLMELLVWFLLLVLVAGGIILAKYNYKRQFNTYQIFLPDVDGLINGSPVRLMGLQIGYVNQIDIVGEDVYVKFIVTEKNVKIPYGSVATVEFSGLGGSKSLELYPPEAGVSNSYKILIPQSPKRIHDSLGLLSEMYDSVVEITYVISSFMDKVGFIKPKNSNNPSKTINDFFDFSDNWLDKAQKQVEKFDNKFNKKENSTKSSKSKDKNRAPEPIPFVKGGSK